MPILTAYGGIFLNYPEGSKAHSKISFDNKVIPALISQLPKVDFYYQQYHSSFNNWLPLYWSGYKQSTRYTYQIDLTQDKTEIWDAFKGNVRTNIRKAEKITTIEEIEFDKYWEHLEKSNRIRNKKNPFNK